MSRGKHRRGANDPVPDVKVARDEYPGGKHADRSATDDVTPGAMNPGVLTTETSST